MRFLLRLLLAVRVWPPRGLHPHTAPHLDSVCLLSSWGFKFTHTQQHHTWLAHGHFLPARCVDPAIQFHEHSVSKAAWDLGYPVYRLCTHLVTLPMGLAPTLWVHTPRFRAFGGILIATCRGVAPHKHTARSLTTGIHNPQFRLCGCLVTSPVCLDSTSPTVQPPFLAPTSMKAEIHISFSSMGLWKAAGGSTWRR